MPDLGRMLKIIKSSVTSTPYTEEGENVGCLVESLTSLSMGLLILPLMLAQQSL